MYLSIFKTTFVFILALRHWKGMYSLMYKMVIIDDNRRELRYVQGALEWENYQIDVVGTFYNPLLALEEIPKLLPDIILTDIVMPQINGFQLVAKALEYNPRRAGRNHNKNSKPLKSEGSGTHKERFYGKNFFPIS